tara:strand:- start:1046 stop:1717 length:672 start_codon:yes stop_codon:yes gene_type:complete
MKDILFHSHLGLGDQIGCNGLVHYLSEKYQCKIFVATKLQNLSNINFLYKDWSNIIPIGIDNSPIIENQQIDKIALDKNLELIRTTITTPNQGYWDESHYSNLGLDYRIKFDYCRLPDIHGEEEIVRDAACGHEKFAFVHDDPSRDLHFTCHTDLFVVRNPLHLNVFQLSPILKKAEELHLMGSSILCLAELLNIPLSHQSAFFYRFRGAIKIRNFSKWNIID